MKKYILSLMLLSGIISTQTIMAHPTYENSRRHAQYRHHNGRHCRHARVVEVQPVVVRHAEPRPVVRPVVVVEHPQPAPRPVVVVEQRPNTAAIAGAVVGGIIGGVIGSIAR